MLGNHVLPVDLRTNRNPRVAATVIDNCEP
jgi:hypothetical protein